MIWKTADFPPPKKARSTRSLKKMISFLYTRSEILDVLWYGVRPSVCLSVRPLATSCLLNILKSFGVTVMVLGRKIGHGQ